MIAVLWDVTPCSLIDRDDGSTRFLRNVGNSTKHGVTSQRTWILKFYYLMSLLKSAIIWVITLCCLVDVLGRFGVTYAFIFIVLEQDEVGLYSPQ
jgi:hypothetical protein